MVCACERHTTPTLVESVDIVDGIKPSVTAHREFFNKQGRSANQDMYTARICRAVSVRIRAVEDGLALLESPVLCAAIYKIGSGA